MKDHTIKADVKLGFWGWVANDTAPPLELTDREEGISIATSIDGTITASPGRLFEILFEAKQMGRRPLLVLEVLDSAPESQLAPAPPAEAEKQDELPLESNVHVR